jgi:ATP-dependent RNA helicase DeaD
MKSFKNLDLSERMLNSIDRMGFRTPTQIQEESIPHIVAGRDVIGESATGSGKTLAFGCGILEYAIPGEGLQSLVLTPTRELAEQIKECLRDLSGEDPLKTMAVYGGVSIHKQIKSLKRADVVVATPGRLLDHIRRDTIDLSKVGILVLDEADRMFDMGFINDVEKIIARCPMDRQTMFFSATISSRVKGLASKHMENQRSVMAEKMVKPEKLEQVYYDVPKNMKLSLLTHLLRNEDADLAMVFCNTRRTANFVTKNLRSQNLKAVAIHGGLSQNNRTKTIDSFNNAKEDVLVCTDVAARGLDINNVSHIYNYECPIIPVDYVHRIGRTARAGEEGKVINLLCNVDRKGFDKINRNYPEFRILNQPRPKLTPLEAIGSTGGRSGKRYRSNGNHPKKRNSGRRRNSFKKSYQPRRG